MSELKDFPYETRLNVQFAPLEVFDEKAFADGVTHKWFNQTLCAVNDSVVRLGVVEGEYHWHKHDADDEFFYVVEGRLLIDLEGKTLELGPRQGVVIPKGVMHRPRAPQRTVMLMVETSSIVPTRKLGSFASAYLRGPLGQRAIIAVSAERQGHAR